jgi:hypothetical protein
VVHATGTACAASACTYASCNNGYADCDGKTTNGCEVTGSCSSCGALLQLCCPGNLCNQGLKCEVAPANDGKCH